MVNQRTTSCWQDWKPHSAAPAHQSLDSPTDQREKDPAARQPVSGCWAEEIEGRVEACRLGSVVWSPRRLHESVAQRGR